MDKKIERCNINYSCKECCAEIASSSGYGISAEVDEYVYHFCGQECYEKWKNRTDCCSDNTE